MELLFLLFLIFLAFFFSIPMAIRKTKAFISKNSPPRMPPGPWKLPLLGNMHQLLAGPPTHHILRDLAMKYGPLMHLRLGEVSIIVVSSPQAAAEIMKTHDIKFAQRSYNLASSIISYGNSDIVFSPYGEYWRQLKRISTLEVLSAKRVRSFRHIREDEVSKLLREISLEAGDGCVNLSKKISSLTYGTTSRAAFGEKQRDQQVFISVIEEVTTLAGGFFVSDMYPSVKFLAFISGVRPKMEKLQQRADRILDYIIQEHRKNKSVKDGDEDLVDVLLKLQKNEELGFPLSDKNIKAVILDIFAAGGETSSTAVEWAMSELLRNPRVMKKAQTELRQAFSGKESIDEIGLQELKYLKAVIKETLRLHPPAPLLVPRECREKCEINGYEIPERTKVIVNAWAIGRNPEYWTEADRFYPERFLDSLIDFKGANFEYIPFGSGRRICPGITFALANIELQLANLLYHFDWKLPQGLKEDDLDMSESFGMTVRRKRDLCLIPIPFFKSSEAPVHEETI